MTTSPTEERADSVPAKSWDEQFHHFWYVATPRIFEWFGWVAVLGALGYIHNRNPSPTLTALLVLGYLSLLFYFVAFFLRHPISIPGVRLKHNQEFLSGILGIALAYGTNRVAQQAVNAFTQGAL